MTRTHGSLILLWVAVALSACSSDTTAPGGGTTTSKYVGTIASPVATGSFTASFIIPASGDRVGASPELGAGGPSGQRVAAASGTTASIIITLLSGQNLTLTGDISGTSFTVSDNATPQDVCTGTVASVLNATCTILGVPGIPLAGLLEAAGAIGALASYCGFETPVGSTIPDASLFIGVAVPYSFLARVATADNSLSFYLDGTATGTATALAISDTLLGSSIDYFSGALSTAGGSGAHIVGGSQVGSWQVTTPCTLTTATLSVTGTVTFNALVNSAPVPANQTIAVTPATVGPLTAVVVPATATWLTVTVVGNTVTLTAAAQSTTAGSPLTATVDVWPQFAAAPLPLQIPVTYNVLSAPPPVIAMTNATMTFTMTQGDPAPAAQTDNVNVTGGPVSGLVAAASPVANWLSVSILPTSASPGNPAVLTATPLVPTPALTAGTYTTNVTIASATPGVGSVMVGITLTVNPAACTITTPSSQSLNVGTFVYIPLTFTGACPTFGNYFWNTNPVLPAGLNILPDIDAIQGTPTAQTLSADYLLTMINSALPPPGNIAAQKTLTIVVGAETGCEIGPVPPLKAGASGKFYDQGLQASTACVQPGDDPTLYTWTLANPPPGLTFPGGQLTAAGVSSADIFGTLPTVTVSTQYTFTLEFDAGQGGRHSLVTTYVLTVNP
jgi:hypothetical protein